jgi:hypothetical protein
MTTRLQIAVLAALCTVSAHAQDHAAKPSTPANTAVTVKGEDGKTESFDAAALAKLPQHDIHAEAHGKAVTCSGPTLSDVVAKVGAPQGEALRGKSLALYVKVSARDDYRVVYSLAEIDTGSHDDVPVLTMHCDGKDLDADVGPFRIVYPGEKRPARWIREVSSVEVLRAP